MATFRVHKTSDYTVMSNTHLRDKNLSLKAKGLLSVMLSLPEEWNYSINGLVAICKENTTAVESALKELKDQNYVYVTKKFPNETQSGRMEYEYDIYEQPQEKQPKENLWAEKQGVDFLGVENSPQLNTNISIPNKQSTNISSTDIKDIVDFLNQQADCRYKADTPKTVSLIKARMAEGFTVEDFKTVINHMVAEWEGTDMEKFLRPETLFGTKFESYLNRKPKQNNSQPAQKQEWGYDFLKGVTVIR